MQKVGAILKNFNPAKDKYISREFQTYGLYLAEKLNDYKHAGLYIRLAKTVHRSILEKALSFCVDSKAKSKGALFMWKLKELRKLKLEMTNPKKIKTHVHISGDVQGVGFRYFVKQKADELGITGWVKNMDDGKVEAVFEGSQKSIEKMVAFCKVGPGRIDNVSVKKTNFVGEFENFTIKP